MKLYLVRHGQTADAEKGIKQGVESSLSPTGKVQTARTVRLLKDKGVEIIMSSPWTRAAETAEIINKTLKKKIIFEEVYRERISSPRLAGKSNEDSEAVRYANEHEKNFCDPRWKFDISGESIIEAFKRAKKIEKILLSRYFDKTVLVVSHADFLRCLIYHLIVGDNFKSEEFKRLFRALSFKNGGITYIYFDEKRLFWRLGNFD
jgi:broad specificity phosphatase PhoE